MVGEFARVVGDEHALPRGITVPLQAGVEATQGSPIASASSTLFCTPRPIRNGATKTSAVWRKGRVSGYPAGHGHAAAFCQAFHGRRRAAAADREIGFWNLGLKSPATLSWQNHSTAWMFGR